MTERTVSAALVGGPSELLRTPLYPFHIAHNAHMVPFAGWEMPLYYGGIIEEHNAVRESAGLFDVSHMGILTVRGASSGQLLSRRTTLDATKLASGQVRYTFLLDSDGMILDDLLVTRADADDGGPPSFVVVPNAATASMVFDLLRQHRAPDTEIQRHNGAVAILAVQGPDAPAILDRVFGWALSSVPFYHARLFSAGPPAGPPAVGSLPIDLASGILASRTGYTGEAGAELFVPATEAVAIANRLTHAGIRPAGLGARDTLRMEKGYLLSGQDFHRDHTPLEAGQSRFVDFGHSFVGREALLKQKAEGAKVRFSGILLDDPTTIPRHGSPILSSGTAVATATSGGTSPTLHRGIALAYLPVSLATPGTPLEVEVRGRRAAATVTKLPFVPNASH